VQLFTNCTISVRSCTKAPGKR